MIRRLLLVANPGAEHVGAHLDNAARELGVETRLLNVEDAYRGSAVARRFNWWLRGRRPNRLDAFSNGVLEACRQFAPEALLTTGIAPVSAAALDRIAVPRLNFLTDDPWNPAHHPPWFLELLPRYTRVFSPRRANLEDLQDLGCPSVSYLPFAYAPEIHFPDPAPAPLPGHDVVFVGGGDRDRLPPVIALIEAGVRVALYGGYWERDARTRPFARGFVDPAGLRRVIAGSKVVLGLVRRANRDGHSMRTYEVPAMRGCLLPEDTPEHREILGDAVEYFRDHRDLVETARRLIRDGGLRSRIAESAWLRITGGANRYQDRLQTMLGTI